MVFSWDVPATMGQLTSEILKDLLIAYAQMPPDDVSNEARVLQFGSSLYLHPYFEYTSSEDSGESAHLRRLA